MSPLHAVRLAACAAALALAATTARADSFVSSASSAGSASSGSVSDSLNDSSNSSSGNKRKVADGNYRILEIGTTPDRAGRTRLTLQQQGQDGQRVVLDLPQATFAQQGLAAGDTMYAQNRVYGIEFGRVDNRQPFYLVLADEWYGELASRPVTL
ncbi:hypothetical protein ASF61_12150 [Duganella sp. Leaf126]|uniref:hypothetical protein n=1 Tax=Duganella sp. Leaf126 TaxID=1736266 RepID=UPI0007014654|nr:hypothetical protein [Duganella sp. Leaf126]KQQ33788.1 hypothetical protein ASF61_12150 [Duganella sp. Leaf126]